MVRHKKLAIEDLQELRNKINDGLTDIDLDPYLKKEVTFRYALKNGATGLTKNKLAYLVSQGMISPKKVDGARNTHLYGREQISNIILIQKLKNRGLSYSKISSLLREEQNKYYENDQPGQKTGEDVVLPQQGIRAQTLLYSRVIAVLLNHLLGNAMKPGIIIHLRERHPNSNTVLADGVAQIKQDVLDLKAADDYVDLIRPLDDIIGFVSSEPERDVIFHKFEFKSILEFKREHWLRVSVKIGGPLTQYDLMIGSNDKESFENLQVKNNSFEARIVGTLMKVLFLKSPNSGPDKMVSANEFDKSTMLNALVNMIPGLSDLWEYSAILTSSIEKPNHLKVSAISQDFPLEMRREVENILIEPGQPLAGWAFQTNYPIVIQYVANSSDPRLAYQSKENATAAIAIPTKAQDIYNGVLYVGTRYCIKNDRPVFSEAEIRTLRIIADVAGEMIERNRITRVFEVNSSRTINLPELSSHDWSSLQPAIESVLEKLVGLTSVPLINDNLHFTIVKIESHQMLTQKDLSISDWVNRHILETTREFFIRNKLGMPEIFIHNAPYSLNQAWEFVCLIPKLEITDEQDRNIRKRLRELLSSLKLTFSYEFTLQVSTNVWSMPFRHKNLLSRLISKDNETKIGNVAAEIMSELEDAFLIIPYIELAHHYEESRAFGNALEQYISAAYFAPNNRYIQRHIAKTYAATGDLKKSAEYWQKILQMDEYPRYYLHYAHILARMGDSVLAENNFNRAFQLDPKNPITLIEWGDFLAIEGKTSEAIKKYEQALKLDFVDRDLIWFRFAEVHFESGDLEKALSFTKLILDRLPDHREAQRLMLKIIKAGGLKQ